MSEMSLFLLGLFDPFFHGGVPPRKQPCVSFCRTASKS